MKLNKAYYTKLEIETIREQIESLSKIGDNLNNKQELIDSLNNKLVKYCDELLYINNFIENIEEQEIRLIARYRLIDNLKWQEIGDRLHLDRTACYRKLDNYIKLHT